MAISGDDMNGFHPTAATKVHGPGSYEIMLSNCDEELLLWVDGNVVRFNASTAYPHLDNAQPTELDRTAPAAVGSAGARLRVNHLELMRDIYYISERPQRQRPPGRPMDELGMAGPAGAAHAGTSTWGVYENVPYAEFPLQADQFLALGDNSAKSKDSRLWEEDGFEYYVKRDLLIGKAFFIYWPHSWHRPVPFFPNFSRMRFVR